VTAPPSPTPDTQKPSATGTHLRSAARLLAPLGILVLMALFFWWKTDGAYLQPGSLSDIGQQAALIVIVGVGATLVIIAGGIDLSVGAVVAFSGTLAAVLMLKSNLSPPLAAAGGVIAGGVIGFFNGFVTVKTRLHPFIITLGSMMIFRGLALALTDAQNTSLLPAGYIGIATGVFPLGGGKQLVIPHILVLYIAIVGIATHVMLTRTRFGRYCFAIGSNAESARLSGIPVDRCLTLYFVLAGLLFGFGGVVQSARIRIGQPTVSEGLELEAIAAAVIGGTSLSGGQGSILGTVLGALLMASLRQGLRMLGLAPYWQTVSLGAAIVIAVVYDRLSRARMR
jgi:ribose transport system permease protein